MPALEVADKGLVEGVLPALPSTRSNRRAVERLVPAQGAQEKKIGSLLALEQYPGRPREPVGTKALNAKWTETR